MNENSETRSATSCRNAIVIDPRWQLDDLVKAYARILYHDEHPEVPTLQSTAAPVFSQFVIAAELGLKCMEGEHEGDIDVAIAAADYGDWLTRADVTRTLDWLGSRANERDLHMVYDIHSLGPFAQVLNSDQFLPTLSGRRTVASADANNPIVIESDDDDVAEQRGSAAMVTPPRKRHCSNDSLTFESPSKKVKVKEEDEVVDSPVVVEDTSSEVVDPPVPIEETRSETVSPDLPTPFTHRRRWTAAQQFAMLSTLYTIGYEKADWEAIAARVNSSNPQGQSKSKTRVKSAMRETHWSKFFQANNDGTFGHDQLSISFPDMSGPVMSTGAAWTSQQKQAVWFETFAFAERNVNWKDVARAVNAAANGDQALYRKPLDCEKTWRDTLRRHFGLQGRERR